jgi:hypothetical protein
MDSEMPLSEDDERELEILQWPYINTSVLNDDDRERLNTTFRKMKLAGSKATVRDNFDYLERKHPDDKTLRDWTRKNITKLAEKYFPAGGAAGYE